jgi:hypothetical protein
VSLLIIPPFSFLLASSTRLPHRLMLSNNTLQAARQDENDLGVPITSISPLSFSFSFPLHLSCRTPRITSYPATTRTIAIRSRFYLVLASPLYSYTLSIHSLSPARPRPLLLYKLWSWLTENAHVYRIALPLVEEDIGLQSSSFLFSFLLSYSPACPRYLTVSGTAIILKKANNNFELFVTQYTTHSKADHTQSVIPIHAYFAANKFKSRTPLSVDNTSVSVEGFLQNYETDSTGKPVIFPSLC